MKIKILVLFTLISISCLSQSIGGFKIDKSISSNPIKIQFNVYQEDSVSISFYNAWGNVIINALPKDLYKAGTYMLEYTLADSLKTDTYIYMIQSSNKKIFGNVLFLDFKGSLKTSDFAKLTYIDSIKVYDTTHVTIKDTLKVIDTTKVLIIDTLNCIKTATSLRNYETFPVSENIEFHDNLTISFSGVDHLVLYDLTGRFIRRLTITCNVIYLQDLPNGIYVGLFYENGDIVKTIKLIKE
jgi:hypothetical protein